MEDPWAALHAPVGVNDMPHANGHGDKSFHEAHSSTNTGRADELAGTLPGDAAFGSGSSSISPVSSPSSAPSSPSAQTGTTRSQRPSHSSTVQTVRASQGKGPSRLAPVRPAAADRTPARRVPASRAAPSVSRTPAPARTPAPQSRRRSAPNSAPSGATVGKARSRVVSRRPGHTVGGNNATSSAKLRGSATPARAVPVVRAQPPRRNSPAVTVTRVLTSLQSPPSQPSHQRSASRSTALSLSNSIVSTATTTSGGSRRSVSRPVTSAALTHSSPSRINSLSQSSTRSPVRSPVQAHSPTATQRPPAPTAARSVSVSYADKRAQSVSSARVTTATQATSSRAGAFAAGSGVSSSKVGHAADSDSDTSHTSLSTVDSRPPAQPAHFWPQRSAPVATSLVRRHTVNPTGYARKAPPANGLVPSSPRATRAKSAISYHVARQQQEQQQQPTQHAAGAGFGAPQGHPQSPPSQLPSAHASPDRPGALSTSPLVDVSAQPIRSTSAVSGTSAVAAALAEVAKSPMAAPARVFGDVPGVDSESDSVSDASDEFSDGQGMASDYGPEHRRTVLRARRNLSRATGDGGAGFGNEIPDDAANPFPVHYANVNSPALDPTQTQIQTQTHENSHIRNPSTQPLTSSRVSPPDHPSISSARDQVGGVSSQPAALSDHGNSPLGTWQAPRVVVEPELGSGPSRTRYNSSQANSFGVRRGPRTSPPQAVPSDPQYAGAAIDRHLNTPHGPQRYQEDVSQSSLSPLGSLREAKFNASEWSAPAQYASTSGRQAWADAMARPSAPDELSDSVGTSSASDDEQPSIGPAPTHSRAVVPSRARPSQAVQHYTTDVVERNRVARRPERPRTAPGVAVGGRLKKWSADWLRHQLGFDITGKRNDEANLMDRIAQLKEDVNFLRAKNAAERRKPASYSVTGAALTPAQLALRAKLQHDVAEEARMITNEIKDKEYTIQLCNVLLRVWKLEFGGSSEASDDDSDSGQSDSDVSMDSEDDERAQRKHDRNLRLARVLRRVKAEMSVMGQEIQSSATRELASLESSSRALALTGSREQEMARMAEFMRQRRATLDTQVTPQKSKTPSAPYTPQELKQREEALVHMQAHEYAVLKRKKDKAAAEWQELEKQMDADLEKKKQVEESLQRELEMISHAKAELEKVNQHRALMERGSSSSTALVRRKKKSSQRKHQRSRRTVEQAANLWTMTTHYHKEHKSEEVKVSQPGPQLGAQSVQGMSAATKFMLAVGVLLALLIVCAMAVWYSQPMLSECGDTFFEGCESYKQFLMD